MLANYPDILKRVLKHEGGYTNHPRDRGGPTNKGITQGVYDDFRELAGLPVRSVKLLAPEEMAAIYDRQYWDKVAGDMLPGGLDYAVFDFGVNSGVGRANQYLQRCLASRKLYDGRIDGIVGIRTLAALKRLNDVGGDAPGEWRSFAAWTTGMCSARAGRPASRM
jgi:lysozyme family protein